ncbi:MAG: hypothetical protein APF81_12750 [Desulfosporosinus sp. BRH_c37]|nr:MAG: hypothetical protein APF81_12750 [Desulfosporosinus sp. BRH_c37]
MAFKLEMASFRFTLRADQEAQLPPYLGSTLRGAMGKAFRSGACMTKAPSCKGCMFAKQCAYAYIFETSIDQVNEETRKTISHFIPHPFVLEPPVAGKTLYHKGEELQFQVALIGKGLQFLPFFIAAFGQAGLDGLGVRRHKFHLTSVEQVCGGEKVHLWDGGNQMLAQPKTHIFSDEQAEQAEQDEQVFERVSLELQTPLRLVDGGRLTADLTFTLLMRSIFRRLNLIGKIHGQGALQIPYRDYLARADEVKMVSSDTHLNWQDWERYSNRQKRSLKMGGLCGTLSYQGDLGIFMPYLRMAQAFHVGKGTVFGLGKVKLL